MTDAVPGYERSRLLAVAAEAALERHDLADALDAAGRAILHWPAWREPYCLAARAGFLIEDPLAGEAFLELARGIERPALPILDEDLYRAQAFDDAAARWRQAADSGDEAAPPPPAAGEASLRLVAGGDVLLGRQMSGWVALRGARDPFAQIARLIQAADLAVVNLETGIGTTGDFIDKGGRQPYFYRALPDMLDVLIEAGIHGVCTANNHAMDYGREALAQQCEILDACGFLHFGAGGDAIQAALPAYARVQDRTIAFIGVETETPCMAAGDDTPGVNYAVPASLAQRVAGAIAVARAHADIVVVSPHWGENWLDAPAAAQREAARRFIDLGADAVLGHSAHVLQGMELHAGCPIIYDMGTLLFDRVAQGTMKDSALFELEFDACGPRCLTVRPLKLTNGRAALAAGDDRARIEQRLLHLSRALDPAIEIEVADAGLCLPCAPARGPLRHFTRKLPPRCLDPQQPPRIPDRYRALKSDLVYQAMPQIDGSWPTPVAVNAGLEVLGARFASPVRPGRGFVCEVYFRARQPASSSRVEARVAGFSDDGAEAFGYTHPVAEGIHPPQRWRMDEIVCDRIVVRPVHVLEGGRYALFWSLVDLEGGEAMPVDGSHELLRGGRVYLGDLVVAADAPNGVAGVAQALRLPRAAAVAATASRWQGRARDFWDSEARPWVAEALARAGLSMRSPEPIIVRDGPWALVIRVETEQGAHYFKALAEHNRFEPALLAFLAEKWSDRVPRPLATCAARAWMLTPDGGAPLADLRDRRVREQAFRDALPQLAQMQIDSCGEVERLLALGVPDRRLEILPDLLARLLADDRVLGVGESFGLSDADREAVRGLLPAFCACCDALAREPLSAGLDHGDLHLDNVRLGAGKPLLFDWDTAAVTHPFCSLLLPYDAEDLRGTAALAAKAPLGEAYLRPWAARTGRSVHDLTRSLHAAIWIAHVVRALLWADLSAPGKIDPRVAKWLGLWLNSRSLLVDEPPAHGADVITTSRPPLLATADNPLLLDRATIARIAEGSWHNVPEDTLFTGVSFNRRYIAEGTSGNLFFTMNTDAHDDSFGPKNVDSVRKAIALGAAAAVVPSSAQGLPDDLPLLRVEHVLTALDHLGFYVRDHLFTGKRVLISGTEGKTGFKNMLRHILVPQIPTHAVTNSSNLGFSILASLASIRRHDRIEIIEAAGTHPGRLAQRCEYVRPHLFVLTEVGNEHLNYHGSQQAVIESKADIVTGLVEGGYGLLNADGANYAAVRKAVLARRRVPLLLFGSTAGCNGRLLDSRFESNRWIVAADIEGRRVEYPLPLLGEHAPLASVSVLLAAYYLGADVERAAADFCDYLPYESQGVLRHIAHRDGEILCYDNASRASVLSYRSALRMATRLTPPAAQGKKVAVIGQMIFLGAESEPWHARLAEWIDDARFDRVILVGKYTEVTYAHLRRRDTVVQRFPDYDRRHSGNEELQALIDAVDAACDPGDLLFVKGEVDELGEHLRTREIEAHPPPAEPPPSPRPTAPQAADASALSGMRPLDLGDLPRYRAAIDQTRRTVWQHYFPFIYLLGQSPGSRFLIDEDSGSICIYYLRQKKEEQHLCLFLLPLPMQTAVLERCIERVKAFNRGDRASLFRVDADEVAEFRGRPNTRIVACPEEYIYAPASYADLSGNKKRNLRRAIQAMERRNDLEVIDYEARHAEECRQVLAQWAEQQHEKYGSVLYRGFTLGCLDQYERFPRQDLFGKIVRLDGKIASFGFAGEMRRGMGNLFITYSDLRVDGLNKFLNYLLLREMEHLEFANASHAGDTPGLAFAKQALGPAYLHRPYQVYAG